MEPTLDKKTSRRKGVGRKRLLALSFTLVLASISSSYFLRRRFRREYEAFVSYGNDLKHIWTAVVLIFFVLLIKKKNRMESEVVIVCVFFQQNENSDTFFHLVFLFLKLNVLKQTLTSPGLFHFYQNRQYQKTKPSVKRFEKFS